MVGKDIADQPEILVRWKIHYFSAESDDSTEHRAKDAEFMEHMAGVVGC
jgi:hypothetical protein